LTTESAKANLALLDVHILEDKSEVLVPLERFESDRNSVGWIANLDSSLQLTGVVVVLLIATAVALAKAERNADAEAQVIEVVHLDDSATEYAAFTEWLKAITDWLLSRRGEIGNLVDWRLGEEAATPANRRDRLDEFVRHLVAALLGLKERNSQLSNENQGLQRKVAQTQEQVWNANDEITGLTAINAALTEEIEAMNEKEMNRIGKEKGLRQELLGLRSLGGQMRRVVFIVDRSESMKREPGTRGEKGTAGSSSRWDFVRMTVENWLTLLPCEEMAFLTFSTKLDPESDDALRPVTDATLEEFRARWRQMEPGGSTNTMAALTAALAIPSVDTIILFTDGEPTATDVSVEGTGKVQPSTEVLQKQILDYLEQSSRQQIASGLTPIPINVIGIGDYHDGKLGSFLKKLAESSSGTFIGR
jgi:hypothetical protein